MRLLENFILDIPYLFLKKVPYAWLAIIFFWVWPPVLFSWILLAIVIIGSLMMVWQRFAWEAKLIREHHSGSAKPFIDRPKMPLNFQFRNIALLALVSALLAWLFQGQFELNFWQWFFMLSGFMLLYMDHHLLGRSTVYILTNQGLGIRYAPGHIDYRLFFSYQEIKAASRIQIPRETPLQWTQITPTKKIREGVLFKPVNPAGFSKQMEGEILLAPTNIDTFLEHIPPYLVRQGA